MACPNRSGCVLESLEVRAHLSASASMAQYVQNAAVTGSVVGAVYHDLNGNGRRDLGERGVAGRYVFLDINANGIREANEGYAVTNRDGVYRFTGLKPGRYFIRHLIPRQGISPLYKTTCRCTTGERVSVAVSAGAVVRGVDFGVRTVPLR